MKNNSIEYINSMKYVFEIATEPSIIGTVAFTGIIAIASIVVFAPAESKPATFVAVVAIFAVVQGSFGAVKRQPAK